MRDTNSASVTSLLTGNVQIGRVYTRYKTRILHVDCVHTYPASPQAGVPSPSLRFFYHVNTVRSSEPLVNERVLNKPERDVYSRSDDANSDN